MLTTADHQVGMFDDILGHSVDVATADMLKERIRAEVLAEALPL
jgi:predicted nucleotidyltransferase